MTLAEFLQWMKDMADPNDPGDVLALEAARKLVQEHIDLWDAWASAPESDLQEQLGRIFLGGDLHV